MNDVARLPAFALAGSMASHHTHQQPPPQQQQRAKGIWSTAEHDRFLDALKKYPLGPWKAITDHIGSRSIRQVQTHAQKYQEKVLRRLNGSSKAKVLRLRQEHRIDHDVLDGQTLISTPGERRRNARKASAAKLAANATPTAIATAETGAVKRADSSADAESDTPVFGDELFRLSLSEFDDDDDADSIKVEDSEQDDGDGDESDLPSLSECLDFFIKCFSATAQHEQPQQHHAHFC